MTNVDEDRKTRDILDDSEFNLILTKAKKNECEFLGYRNPAILCMLRITGKRREEIAALENKDVWVSRGLLQMNFILLKKHHRKKLPDGTYAPPLPPPEIVKRVSIKDPLTHDILEYIYYVKELRENPLYFWPSVRNVFGNYVVEFDKGITGRTVYDVVRDSADKAEIVAWPHLFRETAGAEEVIKDSSLYGVYKVANRINVTERTAWNYMQRHALNVIKRDYQNEDQIP